MEDSPRSRRSLIIGAESAVVAVLYANTLTKRGAYFAVCDTATHFLSNQLAGAISGDSAAIDKDLAANLIPNSRFVSAGVMAVTRSQEFGYSLLYAG
jgi:intracellular sulfur oxidation DsrE/DsrF family protein